MSTTPGAGHHRGTTPRIVAVLGVMLVCLGAAAPAKGVVRFAVPGGGPGVNCTSTSDNCSLVRVLEDIVQTGDEVVVMSGTHNVGSSGVQVRSGTSSLNIHGQDGQPRPRITATATGFVFSMCPVSNCPGNGSALRHLAIDNQGTGGGLVVWGGAGANPLTIEDAQVVAGSAGLGILVFSQTGLATQALIRNTTARSTNAGPNGAAIASQVNLTLRNVTAMAFGNTADGLIQGPMCNDGLGCSGNTSSIVINSILEGGPNGFDVRTNSSTNSSSGTVCDSGCFGNVSLDYSNFDSRLLCGLSCSVNAPGSAHNQTAAPLLVNPATGDFHQQAGSPTVDAGLDDPANGSADFDGNPRKLGAATDIGAFEDGHPRAATGAATNVTETGGTLQGSVNPIGFATAYQFQWGPTTAYGNQLPVLPASAGSGSVAQAVSQNLGGLAPGTTVHYRLVATNTFGTVFAADQSFTTLLPTDRTAPTIAGLTLTNTRFRVGARTTPVTARAIRAPLGTTFRYSLSERATVTLRIDRALPGRRVGRSCRKPTRYNRGRRRCTRYVRAGLLTRRNQGPGRVSTAFSGRIGRRKLAPGRYRVTVGASDAAGNRATARRVGFSIVR